MAYPMSVISDFRVPLVLVWLCLALLNGLSVTSASGGEVVYERDILPILGEHCFACHGPDEEKRKAGLRLDSRTGALAVLKSGQAAIVPGDSGAGSLIGRIQSVEADEVMPPPKFDKPLTEEQRSLLTEWIESGAPYSMHWAFRPLNPARVAIESTSPSGRNAIDAFVLNRLAVEGFKPAPEADRYGLVKRLYYDLLGLLPTPAEVREFVQDEDPLAYERLVDRLLDSEHFGERWGRHWLDKARYADSDGYEKDRPRPHAWKYRDWVIKAINDDMPFDQFTIEQLAGDLLPEATGDQLLATAFHRQTLTNTEGGTDQEQWRVAAVMDRTETTGSLWLGLTVGCARCHTHKYDPISHEEYYRMYAFFNNGDETVTKLPESPAALKEYRRLKPGFDEQWNALAEKIEQRIEELRPAREAWEREIGERLRLGELSELEDSLQMALAKPSDQRSEKERERVTSYYHEQDDLLVSLLEAQGELKKSEPKSPYLDVRIVTQRTKEPRRTHILERGEFTKPTKEVVPGVLSILPELGIRDAEGTGDRLDFARWLVGSENPLTPRVIANHIWANLFGQGIVATRNDFGVRGDPPTHPELLDHLASEFMARGWSRKALIRYIVLSSTYRQASDHRPELVAVDPKNRLLARQNRFRVEAEIVRDVFLDASGLLSRKIGGPSVFPPTSKDVLALTYNSSIRWNVSPGENRYRRGMYTFFKRTAPHPNLTTFDCPDSNTTCLERNRSNTPLAALTTMNNEVFLEAAKGFAGRVLGLPLEGDVSRMREAFLIATVRLPDPDELDGLMGLLREAREHFRAHPEAIKAFLGESTEGGAERASWAVCMRVILNLDEVITRG